MQGSAAPSSQRLVTEKNKPLGELVSLNHIMIDGSDKDQSSKYAAQVPMKWYETLFADRTHSRSPREFKDKLYKIRRVLQRVNTSYKFANGSDVTEENVDLKQLAREYGSVAAQFFAEDIRKFKENEVRYADGSITAD